jgi:hypothetical protein
MWWGRTWLAGASQRVMCEGPFWTLCECRQQHWLSGDSMLRAHVLWVHGVMNGATVHLCSSSCHPLLDEDMVGEDLAGWDLSA